MQADVYNWSGFYVGAHGGYAWGRSSTDFGFPPGPLTTPHGYDLNGWLAGGQVGWRVQRGRTVYGIEADLAAASGIDGRSIRYLDPNVPVPQESKMRWLGTVRGVVGAAFDRLFVYGTGGFAYGRTTHFTGIGQLPVVAFATSTTESVVVPGWVAGAGAEWGLDRNWSVRAEYLHIDLGSTTVNVPGTGVPLTFIPTATRFRDRFDLVRVGLNLRFGGAVVVARY